MSRQYGAQRYCFGFMNAQPAESWPSKQTWMNNGVVEFTSVIDTHGIRFVVVRMRDKHRISSFKKVLKKMHVVPMGDIETFNCDYAKTQYPGTILNATKHDTFKESLDKWTYEQTLADYEPMSPTGSSGSSEVDFGPSAAVVAPSAAVVAPSPAVVAPRASNAPRASHAPRASNRITKSDRNRAIIIRLKKQCRTQLTRAANDLKDRLNEILDDSRLDYDTKDKLKEIGKKFGVLVDETCDAFLQDPDMAVSGEE